MAYSRLDDGSSGDAPNELDAALDRLTSDVAEALGHALRASDKEWKVPLFPLTIGLDHVKGGVNKKRWWTWEIRLTWVHER